MTPKEAPVQRPSLAFSIYLAVLSAVGCGLMLTVGLQLAVVSYGVSQAGADLINSTSDSLVPLASLRVAAVGLLCCLASIAVFVLGLMMTASCTFMCVGMILSNAKTDRLTAYQHWVYRWPQLLKRLLPSTHRFILEL